VNDEFEKDMERRGFAVVMGGGQNGNSGDGCCGIGSGDGSIKCTQSSPEFHVQFMILA
jgi:hypothetical protein